MLMKFTSGAVNAISLKTELATCVHQLGQSFTSIHSSMVLQTLLGPGLIIYIVLQIFIQGICLSYI